MSVNVYEFVFATLVLFYTLRICICVDFVCECACACTPLRAVHFFNSTDLKSSVNAGSTGTREREGDRERL